MVVVPARIVVRVEVHNTHIACAIYVDDARDVGIHQGMIAANDHRDRAGFSNFTHHLADVAHASFQVEIVNSNVAVVDDREFVERRHHRMHVLRDDHALAFVDHTGAYGTGTVRRAPEATPGIQSGPHDRHLDVTCLQVRGGQCDGQVEKGRDTLFGPGAEVSGNIDRAGIPRRIEFRRAPGTEPVEVVRFGI